MHIFKKTSLLVYKDYYSKNGNPSRISTLLIHSLTDINKERIKLFPKKIAYGKLFKIIRTCD